MSFLQGFSIAMGANMILFVLTFLNRKLLYVLFSESDNGLYFLVTNFVMSFSLVFSEWFRLANINLSGKSDDQIPLLGINVIYYTLFLGLILSFPMFFLVKNQVNLFGLPFFLLYPVLTIGLCFVIRGSFQSILLVNRHIRVYAFTFVLWGVLLLGLNVLFLFVFKMDFYFAIVTYFIASFIAALWAFSSTFVLEGVTKSPSLTLFLKTLTLGKRSGLAIIGMFFMIRVHSFALEPFALNTDVGLYMLGLFSVGFSIYQLLQRVSDVAGNILYAHIASNQAKDNYALTAAVCRNILWFLIIMCFIAGIAGKVLIYIIADSRYFNAYLPLVLMLPGIAFMNTGTVLNSSYWGRGYPYYIIVAPYIAGVIALGIDFFMIPNYGAAGASISFSTVGLLWFVYLVYVFQKDSGFSLKLILLPNISELGRIKKKLLSR